MISLVRTANRFAYVRTHNLLIIDPNQMFLLTIIRQNGDQLRIAEL